MRLLSISLVTLALAACTSPHGWNAERPTTSATTRGSADDPSVQDEYPGDESDRHREREAISAQYARDAAMALKAGDLTRADDALEGLKLHDPGHLSLPVLTEQRRDRAALLQQLDKAEREADTQPEAALELTQRVLEEWPGAVRASTLRDSLLRHIAESRTLLPTIDPKLNKAISLDIRNDALKDVFANISVLSGVNIVLDADVPGDLETSISAPRTTVTDVLSLLAATHRLGVRVLGPSTVLIYPTEGNRDLAYRPTAVKAFFLSYASAQSVAEALKALLKMQDVHIDPRINAVVVRDHPNTLSMADRMVQALDRPEGEVTLDVRVLEVSTSDMQNLGMQFPEQFGVGLQGSDNAAPNTLSWRELTRLNGDNIKASFGDSARLALHMLETDGKAQVLANPRIRVKSGKKALIEIGEKIPVISTIEASLGATSERVDYQDVGLKFEVTPNVGLDGEIAVEVDLTVSNLGESLTSARGNTYYRVYQRKAQTTLTTRNNETRILAGLINVSEQETGRGIPGLRRLPWLDRIFGRQESTSRQSEVVLVITPTIERTPSAPGPHVSTFPSGTVEDVASTLPYLDETNGAKVNAGMPSGGAR